MVVRLFLSLVFRHRIAALVGQRVLHICALILLFCIGALPRAHAGYYSVTYSGGVITGSPAIFEGAFGPYGGGYGTPVVAGGGSNVSAGIGGSLMAMFNWVPGFTGEAAPQCAIVTEQCEVSAFGEGGGLGSARCKDGLGDSQDGVPNVSYNPDGSAAYSYTTASRSGTRYSVQSGSTFSVYVSPTASGTIPGGEAGCNVVYAAAASPVTVVLTGTYSPSTGDNRVLTGQQVTASLSAVYGWATGYTWTPSPTNFVFKNYDPSLSSNQLTMLGSGDLSGPSAGNSTVAALSFYDRNQESLTVTCAATLIAPDGVTVLSVTAVSPTISVLKPTSTWGVDPALVPINGTSTANVVGFYDHSATAGTYGTNTTWYPVTISVPTPFSGGSGCFAQLVTPNYSITRMPTGSGASTYFSKMMNAQGTYFVPGLGLDLGFPYPKGITTDSNGNWTGVAGSSMFSVGSIGASGDDPQGAEGASDVDMGGTDWTNSHFNYTFSTWLMFKPSGGVWVPLKMAAWSGSGDGTGGPNNWSASGSYTPPAPSDTTQVPQWSLIITGTSYRP